MAVLEFDKTRNLKFDLQALKDLEANMGGMPLGAIIHQFSQVSVTAITVALYHGLKHEDKGLSVNLVTKMLQKYIAEKKSLRALGRSLNQAIDETGLLRSEDEDTEGNEQVATA